MLKEQGWTRKNYEVLKELIRAHRSSEETQKYDRNYVVADWDNTSAMYDVQDAVFLYQLFELRYAMDPEDFLYVLRKEFEMEEGSHAYRISAQIAQVYSRLYEMRNEGIDKLKDEEDYRNFVASMVYFYNELSYVQLDYGKGCHRILYLFCGMSEEEVRILTREALDFWMKEPLKILKLEFDFEGDKIQTCIRTGIRKISQQADLYEKLRNNNIDVYICTASSELIVEEVASSKALGYGFSKGEIVGMNIRKDEEGRFLAEVDTDKLLTYMQGKADYLARLEKLYSKAPILYMGDSNGDYQALTYPNLKVGLIVNIEKTGEINRLKEMARRAYEGGTRYLLQGRDERIGEFIDSETSIELAR